MTGLIQLYTGDGKGKTTAALGLAIRAAGRGIRVCIAQFLKGRDSGELHILAQLPGITMLRLSRDYGFVKQMSAADLAQVRREHDAMLAQLHALLRNDPALTVNDESMFCRGRFQTVPPVEPSKTSPSPDFKEPAKTASVLNQLLILDEIAATVRHGLIDKDQLLALLDQQPRTSEIVLTGRDAPAELRERADYITEMRKLKHPFDEGQPARKGIEW